MALGHGFCIETRLNVDCSEGKTFYGKSFGRSEHYKRHKTLPDLEIHYGSGDAKARPVYDVKRIGPAKEDHIEAVGLFAEIVDSNIGAFKSSVFDAIVDVGPCEGYFRMMKDRPHGEDVDQCGTLYSDLDVKRFSFCFEDTSVTKNKKAGGWVIWNDSDPRQRPELFQQVQMDTKMGEWAVNMRDVKLVIPGSSKHPADKERSEIVGCSTNAATGQGCYTVVDTGTSLLSLPKGVIRDIQKKLKAMPEHFDCSQVDQLPVLKFMLDDHEFHLPPRAYVADAGRSAFAYRQRPGAWNDLLIPKDSNAVKLRQAGMEFEACVLLLDDTSKYPDASDKELAILGMPFFAHYYATFDTKGKTVVLPP